jgi:hypothetical protein
LSAVHFVIDDRRAEDIQRAWAASDALDDVTLELIDCPDRRLANAALDYSIRMTEKQDVELTLLLPRRAYSGFLGRLLHDQTAEEIAAPISQLPRVVATIVPFDVDRIASGKTSFVPAAPAAPVVAPRTVQKTVPVDVEPVSHYAENLTPIGKIEWRKRAQVQGRVTSIKTAPRGSAPVLQVEIWDETGGVSLQFLGRREIEGLDRPELPARCCIERRICCKIRKETAIAQKSSTNGRVEACHRADALQFGGIVINGERNGRSANSASHGRCDGYDQGIPNRTSRGINATDCRSNVLSHALFK